MARAKNKSPRYCFVSYSTREPHVQILIDCLRIVFNQHFEVRLTPSALESGTSQREQIAKLIKNCSFAVVALDGLRPNVIFEYGMLQAVGKPVLLFKELEAKVDIKSFFQNPPELGVSEVPVHLDTQFSDVKDVNYAEWKRFDLKETVKLVWQEYRKKREVIEDYQEIKEPKLCS